MSKLIITIIDVGWGDSIFIESQNNSGTTYALIDSNDTTYFRSSFIFLKRYFEKMGIDIKQSKPLFEFVILSHGHADHGEGLKRILREFGAKQVWYPKSTNWTSMGHLIKYCNRSSNVLHHQSIDDTKSLPALDDVHLDVLWPPYNSIDQTKENNNSIVLSMELNNVVFLLTGDAEAEVWNQIAHRIPPHTQVFKVPHHGSVNGTFDQSGTPVWLNNCPQNAHLGISSHIRPYTHPDSQVINLFKQNNRSYYRTDEHYHLTFETEGSNTIIKYSHV